MKNSISRKLLFLMRLSVNTYVWCCGVIGGAILLCVSFFFGSIDRQIDTSIDASKVANAEERTIEYSSFLGRFKTDDRPSAIDEIEYIYTVDSYSEDEMLDTIAGLADTKEIADYIPVEIKTEAKGFDSVDAAIEASGVLKMSDNSDVDIDDNSDDNRIVVMKRTVHDAVSVYDEEVEREEEPITMYSVEDIELLCKVVQCEAESEDIYGRTLISNVILNRVADGTWGDSIRQVVMAPGQFVPVKNGAYINAVPDDNTKRAVVNALNGEDYSEGALYFQKSKDTQWDGKTYLFRYGAHSFYR